MQQSFRARCFANRTGSAEPYSTEATLGATHVALEPGGPDGARARGSRGDQVSCVLSRRSYPRGLIVPASTSRENAAALTGRVLSMPKERRTSVDAGDSNRYRTGMRL